MGKGRALIQLDPLKWSPRLRWTWAGSLITCAAVVTTLGFRYGDHVVSGVLACCYLLAALFWIPETSER